MPLHDLTPQLRTRLGRMERAVGWFVFLATALLLFGFGYYLYHLANQRGWFKIKAKFHTYIATSAGLNVGDPVYMMGFSVGHITRVFPTPPRDPHNVRVEFEILDPFFRYIWSEGSYVKVAPAGLLNQRQLEVTRGTNGYEVCVTQPIFIFTNLDDLKQRVAEQPGQWQLSQEIYDENSNLLYRAYTWLDASNLQRIAELHLPFVRAYNNTEKDKPYIAASWHPRDHAYEKFTPEDETTWLPAVETPPVSDQLQGMIAQVKNALPNFLALTNQLTKILSNSAMATSNLNAAVASARPIITNFSLISGELHEPGGPLLWAIGTNGNERVQGILTNADLLIYNLNTNITASLMNLADITSNLNAQVQANSNMLNSISKTVRDADNFVQGLKHFWLISGLFKHENHETNAPPPKPLLTPRQRNQ